VRGIDCLPAWLRAFALCCRLSYRGAAGFRDSFAWLGWAVGWLPGATATGALMSERASVQFTHGVRAFGWCVSCL